MNEAWKAAVKKHPALRLRFDWSGELVQVIDKEAELDWRYSDISRPGDHETLVEQIREADRQERYDLNKGKLFRVYLIKRGEEHYTTIYSMHHAIGDGWSNPVLAKTVHEAYQNLIEGKKPDTAEDRSYLWVQEYRRECEEKEQDNRYWKGYLGQLEEEEDLSAL
jgi:NRPS condensation-like uncharacterized protein